jgi:anti-sigma B factor antagonist
MSAQTTPGWFGAGHPLVVHESARLLRRHIVAWAVDALGRGERVVYGCRGRWDATSAALMDTTARRSARGALDVADVGGWRDATGGDPDALLDLYRDLVARARADGYPRVAMIVGGEAAHTVLPDPERLLAHERDLDRLVVDGSVRRLCAYDLRVEAPAVLGGLVGAHPRGVDDVLWSSRLLDGRLTLSGEIDYGNADRVAAALAGAASAGVRVVDVGAVTFLSAAGIGALAEAADLAVARGGELRVVGAVPLVMRVLDIARFADRAGVTVVPAPCG